MLLQKLSRKDDNRKQQVIKAINDILCYAREDKFYTLYNLYTDLFNYLKTLLKD